ncbi:FecR family protein [Arcticibacter tournemirensis]
MSESEEQHKKRLIKRYKSGQASEEELRSLFTLLSLDELDCLMEEDMDEEIRLQRKGNGDTGGKRKMLRLQIAAAASILLVLSLGFYFFFDRNIEHYGQDKKAVQHTGRKILPGGNKATLTLANGREISLDDALEGDLAYDNGIKIRKSREGQIVCEVQEVKEGQQGLPKTANVYNTISTPRGGQWQVILPDGSKVWLNAASSLTYPTVFDENERRIEMTGEAYFEIAKRYKNSGVNTLGNQARVPFIVKAGGQLVEVLGTHFNINAYTEEKVIKTTLLEGAVAVKAAGNRGRVVLRPGEEASFENNEINVAEVNTSQAVAWKNGDFIFEDQDLQTTMRQIARWYNVEVVYERLPDNIMIGGYVSRSNDVSVVLQAIELTGKVKFRIEGRKITVTR